MLLRIGLSEPGARYEDAFDGQAAFRAWHGQAGRILAEIFRQVPQPSVGGTGVDQHAPVGHQLLDRLDRSPQQDRRGDHDTGRRLLGEHEVGAQGKHGDLNGLTHKARHSSEGHAAAARTDVQRRHLVL